MKLIIAASALTLTVASAAYAPTCRAEGERCKGADYMPAVAWIECCEGSCSAPHPEWGMMCAKEKKYEKKYAEEKPTCRAEGERCIGAANKPPVKWMPCCEGGCDAPHPDWGMMCAKAYTAPKAEKKYVEEKPKCRKKGERCIGAAYKPPVEWIPCCEGGCDAMHPDWGMMCGKAGPKKYYPEPQPICIKEKAECGKSYEMCCGKLECVKSGKKSMCMKPKPKCLTEKTQCGKVYAKCCDKLECVKEKDGYKSMCMKPKCLEEKKECGKGYEKCCDKLECVKEKNGYKSMCMKPEPKCLKLGSMCGDGKAKCCDKTVCEKEEYGSAKKCVTKY